MNSTDPQAEPDPGNGDESDTPEVTQLRVVIEAADWDAAIEFYRGALGLTQLHGYKNSNGAQLVLDVGRATIELVHPELDGTGSLSAPPAPKVRLAFQSADARTTISSLEAAGAQKLEQLEPSSGHSINARLVGPDKLPITIFEPLNGPDFAEPPRHED